MPERADRLPVFRRLWRRAALFEQMADRLDVDMTSASKLDRGDAVTCAHDRCIECRHARECVNWLEASTGLPLPPDFCPNREFFARCEKHAEQAEEDQH